MSISPQDADYIIDRFKKLDNEVKSSKENFKELFNRLEQLEYEAWRVDSPLFKLTIDRINKLEKYQQDFAKLN